MLLFVTNGRLLRGDAANQFALPGATGNNHFRLKDRLVIVERKRTLVCSVCMTSIAVVLQHGQHIAGEVYSIIAERGRTSE